MSSFGSWSVSNAVKHVLLLGTVLLRQRGSESIKMIEGKVNSSSPTVTSVLPLVAGQHVDIMKHHLAQPRDRRP